MVSSIGADPAGRHPKDPLVETYLRAMDEADENLLPRPSLNCTVL